MKVLVTGAAGFIGSHLCDRLLHDDHLLIGLDALLPYYDPVIKENNIRTLQTSSSFAFYKIDLRYDSIESVIDDVEIVFHLAATPGLTEAWVDFDHYESCNVTATQRLLEAVYRLPRLQRFIYVSTSSVYGQYAVGDETLPLCPVSPYGVTKLAGEHLCRAYAVVYGLPLVVMRVFSVYGPRQRPDMAYARFIQALIDDQPLTIYGDGLQVRSNTYVSDCVSALMKGVHSQPGETYNVGGTEEISVLAVIQHLERMVGRKASLRHQPQRLGDQVLTRADCTKLNQHASWRPLVNLEEGLARQVAWQREAIQV